MRISDWSSDVCSSDLAYPPHADRRSSLGAGLRHHRSDPGRMMAKKKKAADEGSWGKLVRDIVVILLLVLGIHSCVAKIGRASCRERVCQYVSISVVAVSLKKKIHK